MKLNLMELAYTEHLTAGTNDINSNNNCYTAKCNQKHNLQVSFELYTLSRKTSLILINVPKIFLCPF